MIATPVEQNAAINVVTTISEGLLEPVADLRAITVVGMIVKPAVLIAKKVHISGVAVS